QAGLAEESVVLPGHDLQEGRLSGAVGSDDADLRPRVEGEIDAFEHFAVRGIEPTQVTHGVDVLGCHGDQCGRQATPGGSSDESLQLRALRWTRSTESSHASTERLCSARW